MSANEATSLVDLPSPILLDIFSRLPPPTVLYVKSVCRTFQNLNLHSEFPNLLHSPSPSSNIIVFQSISDGISCTNTLKYLKFVDNPEDQVTHEICHDPNVVDLDLQLYFPAGTFSLIGSVHGFLCLNYFPDYVDSIYILNPRIREYVILPEAQGFGEWPDLVNYGFGFNPVTFEYKVVRIYQQEVLDDDTSYYKSEGQVYTIGKGYWRSAGHVMYCFDCRPYGVSLYGKLHWLVSDAEGDELICSFDLDHELFESFPTAPGYTVECYRNLRSLGLFGRCLCVCDNNANSHFEVWVMKEYGVTSSWLKEIVINITPGCNDWLCNEMIYLLKVLEDGEVLFLRRDPHGWHDDSLFLHHPVKKISKKLDVFAENILACGHISTSFSLKNFGAETVNVF
ncbi:hypothetical protein CQW23_31097 [Capsicum baccatum]|uniref:F-box domain-containing protein n=1 Tax=Capsicum baccatum TaxID=33114 RepID=A0A2G2V8H3_CAPBA|nr:hypothetical protein CQW23_31097 [Capsicum baccatum]